MNKCTAAFLGTSIVLGLSACSGKQVSAPETTADRTASETTATPAAETAPEESIAVSSEEMKETLDKLCQTPRYAGTAEEAAAAEYIKQRFTSYGLEAVTQSVSAEPTDIHTDFHGGTNVIATLKPQNPNGDILIFSAHHDSMAGIAGANDNASGVVSILELARVLKDIPSDTEIRFISFTGEEEGRVGSRAYVESLPAEERSKMIGDIQIDMLGYNREYDMVLSTTDGSETLLGNLIIQQAGSPEWTYRRDCMSDHLCFSNNGIPSVMVSQNRIGYENHNVADTSAIIDTNKMVAPVQILADFAKTIMSEDTASYLKDSRIVTPIDDTHTITTIFPDDLIYFGCRRSTIDNFFGQTGTFEETRNDDTFGDMDIYHYNIRWFGMEEPILTEGTYRYDTLNDLRVLAYSAGISKDEMYDFIFAEHGEPTDISDNDDGKTYYWDTKPYGSLITLSDDQDDTYQLMVSGLNFGTEVMSAYSMSPGEDTVLGEVTNENEKKLVSLAYQVIPKNYQDMISLTFYQDGVGNKAAYTTQGTDDSNETITYAIDVDDALLPDGTFRHLDKTYDTLVHELGHALFINASQVDINKEGDLPKIFYLQESYTEDSYARNWYERFMKGTKLESEGYSSTYYYEHPTEFVDNYAGANKLCEDMAETFMTFVMTDKPVSDETIAFQKILFFWDYDEMVQIRSEIRANLQLDNDK